YYLHIQFKEERVMEEKKPTGGDKDVDKSEKGDDQFNVDKPFGEEDQAFGDKQADVPAAQPMVVDPVVGQSSDKDKSLDKSGQGVMPNGEIPKQPAWSLDDTAPHVDRMVAAANAAHAQA